MNRVFSLLLFMSILNTPALANETLPEFIHYGNFKHMIHTGLDQGNVLLSDLSQEKNMWGLGALAGRKGEIIQIDGKILVSPGSDPTGKILPHDSKEQAFLFAGGKVSKWHDNIMLSMDMTQSQLETFILDQAKRLGISTDKPFIFRLQGQFHELRWHVVTGQKAQTVNEEVQNHHIGVKKHHVEKLIFNQPHSLGELVGIYSGPELESVITHPNKYFHAHYINDESKISGHVETYSVAKGTILKLPAE